MADQNKFADATSHLDLDTPEAALHPRQAIPDETGGRTFLDTNELILNMGPQHPSTHGVLRVILKLDGEKVMGTECIIGYLHRGVEKIAENRTYAMFNPCVDGCCGPMLMMSSFVSRKVRPPVSSGIAWRGCNAASGVSRSRCDVLDIGGVVVLVSSLIVRSRSRGESAPTSD